MKTGHVGRPRAPCQRCADREALAIVNEFAEQVRLFIGASKFPRREMAAVARALGCVMRVTLDPEEYGGQVHVNLIAPTVDKKHPARTVRARSKKRRRRPEPYPGRPRW